MVKETIVLALALLVTALGVEQSCMNVRSGAALVLQPSTRPRLGGYFTVYGFQHRLFIAQHIVDNCLPSSSDALGEKCDLLWLNGRFPPPFHVEGELFVVGYKPVHSPEILVSISVESRGISFGVPSEVPAPFRAPITVLDTIRYPYFYNYIKQGQFNMSRFHGAVYKRIPSEIYQQSYLHEATKCVGNIGGNSLSLPYKSLIPHPYVTSDCQPLDFTTRVIFGPLPSVTFGTDMATQGKYLYVQRLFIALTYRISPSQVVQVLLPDSESLSDFQSNHTYHVSMVTLSGRLPCNLRNNIFYLDTSIKDVEVPEKHISLPSLIMSGAVLLTLLFAGLSLCCSLILIHLRLDQPLNLPFQPRNQHQGPISDIVPFLEEIEVYECTAQGHLLRYDAEIEVTIPPGAIPPGLTIHVEMGVALYGPFTFAQNNTPVAPILWFCTRENFDFKLPVTFKLPHTIQDDREITMTFAKADHSRDSSGKFLFKKLDERCEIGARQGTLLTKHHCFLCIQAESKISMLKNLSVQKGYCLHVLIKQEDPFTYKIIVACTYFLETCFKALRQLFPESPKDYEYKNKKIFQFISNGEPRIQILHTQKDSLRFTEETENEILASDVDFWSNYDYDYMKLMHDEKMYPPHAVLIVHSRTNQRADITLTVNGMKNRPNFSVSISKQFGSYAQQILVPINSDVAPDGVLHEDIHFGILNDTLFKEVASKWDDFGSSLGVSQNYLDEIKRDNDTVRACFREVLKKWLRQIRPPPTKTKLLEVLRYLDFNAQAAHLEMRL